MLWMVVSFDLDLKLDYALKSIPSLYVAGLSTMVHTSLILQSFKRQTFSALTGPRARSLAVFCTANTLLIASCLFWFENWLLA